LFGIALFLIQNYKLKKLNGKLVSVSLLRPAIFLDRDGVLNYPVIKNGKPYPPYTIEEFQLMPGVIEAIQLFEEAEFLRIVVTNQPDPSRGTQKKKVVQKMHALLRKWLVIDDIFTAWDETSDDYKPGTGMIEKAEKKHSIDLTRSFGLETRQCQTRA